MPQTYRDTKHGGLRFERLWRLGQSFRSSKLTHTTGKCRSQMPVACRLCSSPGARLMFQFKAEIAMGSFTYLGGNSTSRCTPEAAQTPHRVRSDSEGLVSRIVHFAGRNTSASVSMR